jgi:arginyl-tRNA synthetase
MIKQEIREELSRRLNIDSGLEYTLEETPDTIPGDLGTNLAMLLSRKSSRPMEEIYGEIITGLKDSELIQKTEKADRGFLNFHLSDKRLHDELKKAAAGTDNYPGINLGRGRKVLLEFVSSNPTGPLHIGHGRCAVLGDALARLFMKTGYSVSKEYYMNDTGTQIDILGETVRLKCLELLGRPNTEEEQQWVLEKGYKGKYIEDVSRQIMRENGITGAEQLGQKYPAGFFGGHACRIILDLIREDLAKFNIVFDSWVSENSLHEKKLVGDTIELLKEKGMTYESEGALWFKSTAFGDEKDRVLVRKTGQTTYFANDIAYHRTKYERGYDSLINILGADHHSSVKRLSASLKALGYDETRLSVLLYQFVSLSRAGKLISMSTRGGQFITLKEVVDEIGADACRYFLLMRSHDSHLRFDLEVAKKQSPENPVYYIQYAHTRCSGIIRQAQSEMEKDLAEAADCSCLKLETERELMKKVLFYPETLQLCVRRLSPHYLTTFLLDLAGAFHKYYDTARIITEEKPLTLARIELVKAVKTVLGAGLSSLGISAPEKM